MPVLRPASLPVAIHFRENWLPNFDSKAGGYAGKIAKQTQKKIDIQAAGVGAAAESKHGKAA